MMNKFEVKNMDLYYGSFHALKNINIAIPEKEITAFIGPSGCGKSTFLKSLNRMNDLVEGCRISGEEFVKGGNTLKQTTEIAKIFAKSGMDFISVSAGGKTEDGAWYTGYSGNRCMPTAEYPWGLHVYLAEGIKNALREIGSDIPVIVSGKIRDLAHGEEVLNAGQADLIGVCRPALADSDWIVKQRDGREKEIVKCVYCNGCLERDQRHEPVNCVIADKIAELKAKK